jgi:L-histidine N-alpha-methyltransferase
MTLLSPTPAAAGTKRITFSDLLPDDHALHALREDVRRGLAARPKWLPPTWFYDDAGSALFEQITALPEYFCTRVEDAILAHRCAQIARTTQARTVLELGSGSSTKTRRILDALARTLEALISIDVSSGALAQAGAALSAAYPKLLVHSVRADYTVPMVLPAVHGPGPRLVLFLGSSLGNFDTPQRAAFLARVRAMLHPGDFFLLGVDLVKDPALLQRAYDDTAGVTAAFNLNLLKVLNRELGAEFDPGAFRHTAVWNEHERRIEMRLRSLRAQSVPIPGAEITARFETGEEWLTEICAKFTRTSIRRELVGAGLDVRNLWTDPQGQYALVLARADPADPNHPGRPATIR